MNLSQLLSARAKSLWKEAAEKPFVTEMARGCLSKDRFRRYMLQDYLYFLDYIDILTCMLSYTEDPELQAFLRGIIRGTEKETGLVHLPNMEKMGISREEIEQCEKAEVLSEYVDYMKRALQDGGLAAGLTALLQCSWVYAYIGQTVTSQYADEIEDSPYKGWFDAYTIKDYISANQAWIDLVDRETADISEERADQLCEVFVTCAGFENRFWDYLYTGGHLTSEVK